MKYGVVFLVLAFAVVGPLIGSSSAAENDKNVPTITRSGSQPSTKGPGRIFTGNVRIDFLFPEKDIAPYSGAYLTFDPGARTFWHSHPGGQNLIVTFGSGLTGYRDGTIEVIKAGDVIWCPPGVDHWHGAGPDTAMTHLALTGFVAGKNHAWKEKVTDEEYNKK